MNHLNEDKLIQYAFDLTESQDRQAAQQHLDECEECRKALDILKQKFTAMDTLAGNVPPSEELIQQTLNAPKKSNIIPLYRRWPLVWSAAAAAIVIMGILLLQNPPAHKGTETGFKSSKPLAADLDTPQTADGLKTDGYSKSIALKPTDTSDLEAVLRKRTDTDIRIVNVDQIPDKPPFAPASAIELIVLPKPDKTQITIYNSKDLTLVRDTRKLTLKPGWNWLQFMWTNTQIDPTSLSLTPLKYADKIDIELISYPARLKDIGRWLIRSEVEGAVPFEITYFVSGLSWRAFYMGTMNENETTMDLKGYVNVSNHSGQDFKNTQTRLIVGETRLTEEISYLAQRRYPYGPDILMEGEELGGITERHGWYRRQRNEKVPVLSDLPMLGGMWQDGNVFYAGYGEYALKGIEKKGLSEYFLYTIEGTENLTDQWTKRLPSFDVKDIPVKSLYKYDDGRYGKQPVRFVSFVNDTEHELGETPIPEGNIKIYRNVNEQKNLSYVGQSNIKYIPVNEDIELNLGSARLVKVEPVLIETKTENHIFDKKGNTSGWDDIETYQVTITNTRNIPIDIEITWNMGTDAWELKIDKTDREFEYKKHDKSRGRFTMTVPARSEKEIKYTIRKYRQKRIEIYIQKQKEQNL